MKIKIIVSNKIYNILIVYIIYGIILFLVKFLFQLVFYYFFNDAYVMEGF